MKVAGILAVVLLLIYIAVPWLLVVWLGLDTVRDAVLFSWGLLTVLLLLFMIFWVIAMWRGINGLIANVRSLMNDDIRPMITTTKETANNVTGTTRFIGDSVAQPIIRFYGVAAGVRKGVGVFTGLTGGNKKKRRQRERSEQQRRTGGERQRA